MLNELATLLHELFATDQSYHAQHQKDGTYKKKAGAVTKTLLERTLRNSGSLAIYQRNNDFTIKWICFDFDISKSNLYSTRRQEAQIELERTVNVFCQSLERLTVPYLLEFSGNRGFHVWITFQDRINYRTGYEILQALIETTQLTFNKELIAIDLFPKSGTATDGPGLGVKVPLSKHTKSEQYATLLSKPEDIGSLVKISTLDADKIKSQIDILKNHRSTTKSALEETLGTFFHLNSDETFRPARVKSIAVQNNGFTLNALLEHWKAHLPLAILSDKIEHGKNLSNEDRKLLVGLLYNIKAKNVENAGQKILLEIFSKAINYNPEITTRSIKKLSSFNFPSQEQIENTTKEKFDRTLSIENLINACIPTCTSFQDATFDISRSDIEITKIAELSYLFLNDEAQSKATINELSSDDNHRLLNLVNYTIANPKTAAFYKHIRNEKNKQRTLISLKAPARVTTSCILKQLIYFLNIQPSNNSHGYRPNKGFSDGYIFQPWLYLWIKFVSNISSAIEDDDNKDYWIIKTDIKNFYDTIPHDNLKRLLLGGSNPRIDAKLNDLSEESKQAYVSYINTLFEITEVTVNSKNGLPQGPAYARYLAELYLDTIDINLDTKLQQDEIYLYQRYVDDIFIISPTEEAAKSVLMMLRAQLELLGLEINNEKTSITKIRHFSTEFNAYRSQSKYAVDRVSRNFADSTTTQKNLAINEFIKLVQSDSCNDDLAFIFSHLAGIPTLDLIKREKVAPTLKDKIGRGSLYKHLFNFVLDSSENWDCLDLVEELDELQSEVLTACFITAIEASKASSEELKKLIIKHEHKLSKTELTNENIAYLSLALGADVSLKGIPEAVIINCLASMPEAEGLAVTSELIERLNTELNNIKELPRFIEAIYPLCASTRTDKKELNNLAATFYAKLATDEKNGDLSTNTPPDKCAPSMASKYYYLLCLFSISNRNKSVDLLKSAWKYCAHIFNTYDTDINQRALDWFKKIDTIEYNQEDALLLISMIVDGNIFRGLTDKRKIFEKFHNLLLIYITFQDNSLKSVNIERALKELENKAIFYKWLIEQNDTSLFPKNKSWFEKNIVENSSIMLKKGNTILFRRPTTDFHPTSTPINEHNGYSEILVEYNAAELRTLTEAISEQTVPQKLKKLIETINANKTSSFYPNIYCRDRLLIKDTISPFSHELSNSRTIILEDNNGDVETLQNNQKNFIKGYFRLTSESDPSIRIIKEKYIDNLIETIEPVEFIRNLLSQIEEITSLENNFYYDIAAAAALYLSIADAEPAKKIERFVHQYHRFNQKNEDRHIYAVDQNLQPIDSTPIELLETIEKALKLIPLTVTPSLTLYLHKDIAEYKNTVINIVKHNETEPCQLDLNKFKRIRPFISPINEQIHFDGKDYPFNKVRLINITTEEIHQFDTRHSIAVSSSEHVYFYERTSNIYIVAIHSPISVIYKSITDKFNNLSSKSQNFKSYPTTTSDENSIVSLNGFSLAVDVISTHRDISKPEAKSILVKWLSSLPKKLHQPLTTLISAHIVMRKDEINNFVARVESLLGDEFANPFLIKEISDYNGTHRILYKYSSIGRSIENFSPSSIKSNAERATIIADTIITGSQIITAMDFYLTGIETRTNSKHFSIPDSLKEEIKLTLRNIKTIDICTILYTESAKRNIEQHFRNVMNENVTINIICGKNIGDDALFGTTSQIGENEKASIRNILKDSDAMRDLYDHLEIIKKYKDTKAELESNIDKTNLVARYQSLPKKCFPFLKTGLRHDPLCHPLVRILELNE